jgi:hypothetical protein
MASEFFVCLHALSFAQRHKDVNLPVPIDYKRNFLRLLNPLVSEAEVLAREFSPNELLAYFDPAFEREFSANWNERSKRAAAPEKHGLHGGRPLAPTHGRAE